MATLVGTQSTLAEVVRALVELDYDAIEAYRATVERLKDGEVKRSFGLFMADHERHIMELTAYLAEIGEDAPTSAYTKAVLTKGKVIIGSLFGDRSIMLAMKTNETDTNRAYERAVTRTEAPAHVQRQFARALSDERRHAQYIDTWLSVSRSNDRTSQTHR